MRASILISLIVLSLICMCDGWWSSGGRSRSYSRTVQTRNGWPRRTVSRIGSYYQKAKSLARRTYQKVKSKIKTGPFLSIRPRDSTGHRTGLGTIAKSFWKSPKKTWNSFGAFKNSYNAMRKANVIGGNLKAHQKGNYDATKIGGKNIAAGISAFREQYKTARVKINPDWSVHIGDTRTPTEIKKVMDANRQGREDAG